MPRLIAGAALAAAVILFVMPAPDGVPPAALRGAAVTLFAVGLYATSVIPEFLTALLFFLIAVLLGVAPAGVVFSGFESTAMWLVFGGLVIGVAVKRTGLGERLAATMTGWFGNTYAGLIGGMVVVGVALAFLMPSTMGRVILLMPIVVALADRLGFEPGSNGRTGLVLAAALGTWMPSTAILPANVPNMVLAGTVETLYGISFTYGSYLLLHFPVSGLLKAVAIFMTIVLMFPDHARPAGPATDGPRQALGRDERLLSFILAGALVLWATDFLHGISPAWVSLGAGLICMLPFVGLVPLTDFNDKINFASLFYVAGILSLGAVVAKTGLGSLLGHKLLAILPLQPGASAKDFASMVGLSTLVGMAVTMPGVPAIISPLSAEMARASGLPLLTVLMTQVIGYSTVILPYQVPPMIVAMQIGGVRTGPATRLVLVLALVTLLVLTPINYFWWKLLGYFG